MERPVYTFHIVYDREGFAYQRIFRQRFLKTLNFAQHDRALHGILIGALNDKVSRRRPSQVLLHHPVRGPHRTIKLEPMDHVVIDPDAGDSYCGDDQKNAAQNGDDLTSSHTNLTEPGKQRGPKGIWMGGLVIRL